MHRRELLAAGALLASGVGAAAPDAQPVLVAGGRRLTLVDTATLVPLRQIERPATLALPPLLAPDGRQAWLAGGDGTLARLDLAGLEVTAEARLGAAPARWAASGDGRYLLAAFDDAPRIELIDAGTLAVVQRHDAIARDGRRRSPVSALAVAAARRSFVVAFATLPEVWEVSYDPRAEDIYEGLVHDFRMGEGVPKRGFLQPRRTELADPLAELAVDTTTTQLLGRGPDPARADRLAVINLDVRRRIGELALAGEVAPAGAAPVPGGLLALPNRRLGRVDLVDLQPLRPRLFAALSLPGPGGHACSHPASRHWWADAAVAGGTELVAFEGAQAAPAARLAFAGGVAELGYTRDGRRLLVLQRDGDERLVWAVDSESLRPHPAAPLRLRV